MIKGSLLTVALAGQVSCESEQASYGPKKASYGPGYDSYGPNRVHMDRPLMPLGGGHF